MCTMKVNLLAGTILIASMAALVCCENQPAPPKLLDPSNPSLRQLHILAEVIDSSGGYKLAEELVDLDAGKAAYTETKDAVRWNWLIDVNENTIYGYRPYICEKTNANSRSGLRLPPLFDPLSIPEIQTSNQQQMSLYGILAILRTSGEALSWQYSRTPYHDGKILHIWSLVDSNSIRTMKLTYSERTGTEGLSLDLIEVSHITQQTKIKIMSISHNISLENRNKLELPLIYGCQRSKIYADDMRQKFDIISADQENRYHLRAQARAINFANNNPETTEQNEIELAIPRSRDVRRRLVMFQQKNSERNLRTLVDYTYGVMFEANLTNRKCEISKIRPSRGTCPIALRFSNKLNLTVEELESMLYGVTPESFMKLEQHGHTQHAYFAQNFLYAFGPAKVGRVVRKFSFGEDSRPKLDSVAIWVFATSQEGYSLTIQEMFEFNFVENKLLDSGAESAQALDVSQECYIENEKMVYGRDYIWASLTYETNQANELRSRSAELKSAFYQQIRTDLKLNHLRVPKLELTFGETSFMARILVLDSLPPHLIYHQKESLALDSQDVHSSSNVASIDECSNLCRRSKCTAMTYSTASNTCSIATRQIGQLVACSGAISYISESRELELVSLDELGLDPDATDIRPSEQNLGGILGIEEFTNSQATRVPNRFGNLCVSFSLDGRSIELTPTNIRIEADS